MKFPFRQNILNQGFEINSSRFRSPLLGRKTLFSNQGSPGKSLCSSRYTDISTNKVRPRVLSEGDLKLVMSFGCQKWPKPSPISYKCHQHILSPTSGTNMDVTLSEHDSTRSVNPQYNHFKIGFLLLG